MSSRLDKLPTERQKDIRDFFKKGTTVFLILRHRASSGMQREIGVVIFKKGDGGSLIDLHPNHAVSEVLGLRLNKNGDGVIVRGAGMDMGMHLVTNLSYALYGDEKSLKYRWL